MDNKDIEKSHQQKGDSSTASIRGSRASYVDDSPITGSSQEKELENTGNGHYSPIKAPGKAIDQGVSVERAEAEFAELSKELSHYSHQSATAITKTHSRRSKAEAQDLEKATSAAVEDGFDLQDTLRGTRDLEQETGIKSKQIGVVWENLTVRGVGGAKFLVRTFPDSFVSFFDVVGKIKGLLNLGPRPVEVDILKDFRGVANPGEMILVLGRPSSGCTTFLKTISNQRAGYTSVDGNVMYGPFDPTVFAKRFRGEAVYCDEDDNHHATLSVEQTLRFALDLKTPGKRPPGMTKALFRTKIIDLLLRMFNIEHTRKTVLGNAFIRGVSGGERKRVSIAEMMISSASLCSWDCPTRGLDASTASDYVKSLRILTNIYETTTFASLYQASETIYKQFDKVMVIDAGRLAYFGPTTDARVYFETLGFKRKPRQTTPDYLTGCTDAFEREYEDGYSEANAPHDSETLAQAFLKSKYSRQLDEDIATYKETTNSQKKTFEDFEMAHHEAKRRHTSRSSVYGTPFYLQVAAIARRQFLIKWQDKFALSVSWCTSMLIAIILGTVWFNIPTTSAGAFTRGGLLFIALLFNAFQAFGELASTVVGRPIVNKHRSFAFHRPSALWIAQVAVDITFQSVQIFVFSVLVYFMCGLVRDPGAFFIFYLSIVTGYLVMTLFFRVVGCISPDFDVALRLAVILITLLVLTNGYLIQYDNAQPWLRWIFYINGLGLGFSAMMINEFTRIDMTCTAESLIPSGTTYQNLSHQVCTLPGSEPGKPIIHGSSYLEMFSYYKSDLWRNWGIMVALIVIFLSLNVFLGERVIWNAGGGTFLSFAKENKERKERNEKLLERREKRRNRQQVESSDLNIASKAVLTWENLCYDVPVPGGKLRLLNNVFGYVKPGELTALMGASGAGKTTLLDVLAARKNIGVISGDILIDAVPVSANSSFQRSTSYAEQLDVHEPTATVREALRFSATLRQPHHVPEEEKYAYVEEVISLLEMEDIADAVIGFPGFGLAAEQRKRVTIGVELAAKPELLLFLDEPTSGLDSQSAFNIVRFLKKLAAANQAILCTIHQPNSALFENFDRLLLLQKGGECVYFGEIGNDASTMIDYFHQNGADCPPDANPAEWMLEAIGAGNSPRIGDRDWGEVWNSSPDLLWTKEEIVRIKAERVRETSGEAKVEQKEYATPLWHQIQVVNKRTHLAFWRTPNYGFTRLFNHVVLALVAGLSYVQLDDSRSSLQERVFIVFQVTVLPALILAQVQPKYEQMRLIYYREAAAKAYKQIPFALSMVLAEMPYSILCAVCFYLPLYYIPGLQSAPSRAGYQFLMILIVEFFSVTLGQFVAASTPSSYISMLFNPPIIITFALFCGVTIPKPQIPTFWRSWLYELDPFTRLVGGMVVTELHERSVECNSKELNRFTAPPGQDCGSYMQNYFSSGGLGYLVDNATSNCEYCAFKVGDQFYEPLGFSFDNRWRDLGIMASFFGFNLLLIFIASRYLNFNRR